MGGDRVVIEIFLIFETPILCDRRRGEQLRLWPLHHQQGDHRPRSQPHSQAPGHLRRPLLRRFFKICARCHYTISKEIIDLVLDRIRQLLDIFAGLFCSSYSPAAPTSHRPPFSK
ncbi:unnamed protein product [Oikopleura dioica]|uniref:Uncharacterized protein n=1 Tax=Oikopleura dioica TaxID=34765 RepID=E4X1B8_OIKDI|nr:unnamed protein product [Oikopleura dioica]